MFMLGFIEMDNVDYYRFLFKSRSYVIIRLFIRVIC